jgi:hypothetical protein
MWRYSSPGMGPGVGGCLSRNCRQRRSPFRRGAGGTPTRLPARRPRYIDSPNGASCQGSAPVSYAGDSPGSANPAIHTPIEASWPLRHLPRQRIPLVTTHKWLPGPRRLMGVKNLRLRESIGSSRCALYPHLPTRQRRASLRPRQKETKTKQILPGSAYISRAAVSIRYGPGKPSDLPRW